MNAVDTNILLYIHDPRDARKRFIAGDLVADLEDAVLLWQVACEYMSAARKLAPFGFDAAAAARHITMLSKVWDVALPTWETYERATILSVSGQLSWWDSLIVAASLKAGVTRLFSEDFSVGSRIDTLQIVNPFQKQ